MKNIQKIVKEILAANLGPLSKEIRIKLDKKFNLSSHGPGQNANYAAFIFASGEIIVRTNALVRWVEYRKGNRSDPLYHKEWKTLDELFHFVQEIIDSFGRKAKKILALVAPLKKEEGSAQITLKSKYLDENHIKALYYANLRALKEYFIDDQKIKYEHREKLTDDGFVITIVL